MKRPHRWAALTAVAAGLAGCGGSAGDTGASDEPVLVLAAANLTAALEAAVPLYEAQTGEGVTVVFGSSGNLAAQIRNGAPADVFISANETFLDELVSEGRIDGATRTEVTVGRLALVVHPGRELPRGLPDLVDPSWEVVAIANPEHAPYGIAARSALEATGAWDALQGRLVMGENVAQTLQYVRTGNADAGLVALSLVRTGEGDPASPVPHTVVDTSLHTAILQVGGVVAESPREDRAAAFLSWLTGPDGDAVLRRYGFEAQSP